MPAPTLSLPIVNVADFGDGSSANDLGLAKSLVSAFQDRGFAYISGYGVSQDKTDAAFEQAWAVMRLPAEKKMKMVCGTDGIDTRGYAYPGMAKITQNEDATGVELAKMVNMAPGTNETFRFSDIGVTKPERIPSDDFPQLPTVFQTWFDEIEALYRKLLRMIGLGLGIGTDYFDKYHKDGKAFRTLAVQHYLGGMATASGARLNEHTDYGFITILFQDKVGGLEVIDAGRGGEFIPAPPVDGCVTVNVGDMLSRWTNGILKSTMHRVRAPPNSIVGGLLPERISLPVFFGPSDNTVVDPIPGTYGPERPKLFPPVNATEHIRMRQAKMYSKKKADADATLPQQPIKA